MLMILADIGENRRYQYRTRLPPRLRSPSTEELFAGKRKIFI